MLDYLTDIIQIIVLAKATNMLFVIEHSAEQSEIRT